MNLDNKQLYKKLDKAGVAKSISLLPDQVRQVLDEARLIKVPKEYSKVSQVVVNGMGGSNIGVGIVKSVFSDQIKVPITITPGYSVPAHINKNTLYLLSSYSGTTEETLSVYKEVKKRKACIMGITTNGKLARLMLKDNIPGYIFSPEQNPSGQPRLGLGYAVFGVSVLLAKAGLFKIKVKETEDAIASLEIWDRELRTIVKTKNNIAKQLALKLQNNIPILVAAEHLIGNIRTMRNQIAENSKQLATYLTLPDLNHFAMEGLKFPGTNKNNLIFFFINSRFYHDRVKKRSELTKKVVKKNNIQIQSIELTGTTKIAQAFELLQLGTWITYYLGMLNQVDPVKIPYVDWFKEQLK